MHDHGNKDPTRLRKVAPQRDTERHGNHTPRTPSVDHESGIETERNKSFDTTHIHASTTSRKV